MARRGQAGRGAAKRGEASQDKGPNGRALRERRMPHWRSMTDRETLGAWDLVDRDGKPKDWTLEIQRVEKRLVKSKERPKGEHRPHVFFRGASKPLVCNATNAESFSSMAGSEDTDRWVGLRVTLYQTKVRAKAGGQVMGIRVRPMKATAAPEEMGDGQPVDEAMRAEQEAAMREPGIEG